MHLLQAGTVFGGRYEIVRSLSTGGMGAVYEVLHKDTRRKRAMKVMLPHVLANDDMRARFKREGVVTAGIESEHLVEVFDVGIDEASNAPYLVMELLRGEDLGARVVRGERTKPAEVLEIFEQVCRALEHTHAAGIVHRDLKPENLFVTRRDDGTLRMKILDFGIAKLIDRSSKDTASVGTPLFMAPEQMTGRSAKIGPQSDIYALAQIAFTLLVGTPYFQPEEPESTNLMGILFKVTQGTVEPATARAHTLGVELPYGLNAWFSKSTSLDPDQRYPTVAAFLSDLRAALKGAPEELPNSSAKRRVVAFQPTQPVTDAPPMTHAMAKSAQAWDMGEPSKELANAKLTRASAGQHTGPVPSSRTLSVSERAVRPKKAPVWIVAAVGGAALLGGGLFYALRGGGDTPAVPATTERTADATAVTATTSVTTPTGPEVSPGETQPPATITAPATPTVTASASASVTAQPGVAVTVRPTALIPSKIPTVKPTAVVTQAPTVWGGPRN